MTEPESSPEGERHAGKHGKDARPSDAELFDRLNRLDASLSRLQGKKAEEASAGRKRDTSAQSGAALAFRLGAEFVSGTLVGALIGYGLDRFFSISPWGLIIFTLVGFAAGVLNMMRAAGEGPSRGQPKS
ncbi:AtpZ/AtpI family protein [Xanthobacter sp. TB0136]|uniref:AtpZ/AtpI family protein n=1 Tax=Xanthobacter sp. TB0136 TaxID=3459177 RepID=UPI0040393B06